MFGISGVDCLGRLNSDFAMKLRDLWLDSKQIPEEVRERTRLEPIVPGTVPQESNVEFTAPIAGDMFNHHYNLAVNRKKAAVVLGKRHAVFQKPTIRRSRQGPSGSPPFKRQKQEAKKPQKSFGQQKRADPKKQVVVRASARRGGYGPASGRGRSGPNKSGKKSS